jgi:hypothetical protein
MDTRHSEPHTIAAANRYPSRCHDCLRRWSLAALLLTPLIASAHGQNLGGETRSPNTPTPDISGANRDTTAEAVPHGWIKLTHKVGGAPRAIYFNVDHIVLVGESPGNVAGYPTLIQMVGGAQVYVLESMATVITSIERASNRQ